jgi:hypothetical protein
LPYSRMPSNRGVRNGNILMRRPALSLQCTVTVTVAIDCPY